MRRLLYGMLFVVPLLLLIAVPAQAQANVPRFEKGDCTFAPPPNQPVECGTLVVPENRANADGPTITLPVAIFKSKSANPKPDPIIYLAGGPGGNTVDGLPDGFSYSFSGFMQADRDFIMFDQRGVGLAQPSLDCPEYTDMLIQTLPLNISDADASKMLNDVMTTCYNRLVKEGIDVSAFNSAANAADVADLQTALGYDQVNLLGISYGTRLALTIMRDHPEGIRSVILDSVFPPEIDSPAESAYAIDRVFHTLFTGCAANPNCNRAYPDLKTLLLDTAKKLDDNPVMVSIKIPPSTEPRDALLNGTSFMQLIYQLFYISSVIPQVPQIISDASRGNFDYLSYLTGFLLEDSLTEGILYEYTCQEDYPFTTLDKVIATAKEYPDLGKYIASDNFVVERDSFTLCKTYFTGTPNPLAHEAVSSDIPTLVMSAEYDPVTPPKWGEEAASHLSNSHYFLYPGLGHGVTPADPCPLKMAVDFVNDPTKAPDDSCISTMTEPDWVVPAQVGEIHLSAYNDPSLGISSVVPDGWTETSPGVIAFGSDNAATIAFRVPEDGIEGYFKRIILTAYGYSEVPAPSGTVETDAGTWTLYQVEGQGVFTTFATTTIGGKDYVVGVVAGSPDDRTAFYDSLLLPALKAFKVTASL